MTLDELYGIDGGPCMDTVRSAVSMALNEYG